MYMQIAIEKVDVLLFGRAVPVANNCTDRSVIGWGTVEGILSCVGINPPGTAAHKIMNMSVRINKVDMLVLAIIISSKWAATGRSRRVRCR